MQRRHGELVFLAQSPEQRGVALSRTAWRELTGEELVHSLARHAGQRAEQRGGDAEGQRQQRVGVHGERHGVDQRGLGDHPRHLGDARHRFKRCFWSASFSRCSLATAAANADAGETAEPLKRRGRRTRAARKVPSVVPGNVADARTFVGSAASCAVPRAPRRNQNSRAGARCARARNFSRHAIQWLGHRRASAIVSAIVSAII